MIHSNIPKIKSLLRLSMMFLFFLFVVSVNAQQHNPKLKKIKVAKGKDESGKKYITPKQRKKLQSKDFIERRKSLRNKLTEREKRQIDRVLGVNRKANNTEAKKKDEKTNKLKNQEKKLRKKHLSIQKEAVRKRIKKNLKKAEKKIREQQQYYKRKNKRK
jgi:hypothetical protein